MHGSIRSICCIILLAALCGCASSPHTAHPVHPHDSALQSASEHYWWQAKYTIDWPEDSAPQWWVDALLANEMIAPSALTQEGRPLLWRFHRRAARDASGHQFTFRFYTTRSDA